MKATEYKSDPLYNEEGKIMEPEIGPDKALAHYYIGVIKQEQIKQQGILNIILALN